MAKVGLGEEISQSKGGCLEKTQSKMVFGLFDFAVLVKSNNYVEG